MGLPRHLSQHTGGFVLTKGPLSRMVPVENASMPDRTVIQWDKDDLDAAGPAQGRRAGPGHAVGDPASALDLIGLRKGYVFAMQDIPAEDSATYDMVCQADTIGVFQIESRAQMSMLPRLRPRCFYDLVIEVAIVRPGPIQGGMVHPYLNRRQGKEPVTYPSEALRAALGRTLGVPVFQEQVMQIAMLAAGFTPARPTAAPRHGRLEAQGWAGEVLPPARQRHDRARLCARVRRGHLRADPGVLGIWLPGEPRGQLRAAGLCLGWIKRHQPAAFLVALLNSQPLGFYSASQLVQDAKRHGVEVRRVDVMSSEWDCTLEGLPHPPAVRLGLRLVAGLKAESALRILKARRERPFDGAEDLARRAEIEQHEMTLLAAADALMSLAGHRRQQVWEAAGQRSAPQLLKQAPVNEEELELPAAPEGEEVVWDYAATGLTLRRHPLAILRPVLAKQGWCTAAELHDLPDGRLARACGIVTVRQQPETAKGVMFVSLEDETGSVQVIVWPKVKARLRGPLLRSRLLAVKGAWQRDREVRNLIAAHVEDLLMNSIASGSARRSSFGWATLP
jgi:error-prone DNA polymerase